MVGIAGVGGCFHILINTLTIHARIVMSVDGGVSCGGGSGVGGVGGVGGGGGGGWWWVLKGTLVFRFGPRLGLKT